MSEQFQTVSKNSLNSLWEANLNAQTSMVSLSPKTNSSTSKIIYFGNSWENVYNAVNPKQFVFSRKLKTAKFDSLEINSLQAKEKLNRRTRIFFQNWNSRRLFIYFQEMRIRFFVNCPNKRPSRSKLLYSWKSISSLFSLISTQSHCQNPARGTNTNQWWTERRASRVFVVFESVTHFA